MQYVKLADLVEKCEKLETEFQKVVVYLTNDSVKVDKFGQRRHVIIAVYLLNGKKLVKELKMVGENVVMLQDNRLQGSVMKIEVDKVPVEFKGKKAYGRKGFEVSQKEIKGLKLEEKLRECYEKDYDIDEFVVDEGVMMVDEE